MERCVSPAWRPKRFAGRAKLRLFISPVREGSIVAKATTTGGFRTVRVGKRSSAQTALAAKRAGALGGVGLRGIGSSRAVAAIGLRIRRFHANRHSQNAHACDAGQSALHHLPLPTSAGARNARML